MAPVTRMTSFVEIVDEWTQITDGQTFVLVQAISQGVVYVHPAAAADDDPEAEDGHLTISRNQTKAMESSFSAGGLPAGTKVFVRAAQGQKEIIAVLAY